MFLEVDILEPEKVESPQNSCLVEKTWMQHLNNEFSL